MKVFFKNTKSTSKKTILAIFMMATLALSPLVPQLVEAKADANKSFPIALNLMQIIDQLNLSKKQLTKIQNNLQSHQKEYLDLTSNISTTKNQLLQLPTKASEDQLKSLAHVQSENINKLLQLKVKVKQEIFSILTPEQTKQLTEKWQKLQQKQLKDEINNIQPDNSQNKKQTAKKTS